MARDTLTINPHNTSSTPDVLDVVMIKNLSFPVYLSSCGALSSGHLLVLLDTTCHSSFHHLPVRPIFRRTNWTNFQTHLKEQIQSDS